MFLVAIENVLQRDHSFEGAAHGAIGDGEQGPSLKVRQGAGEGEIGEEDGSAFGAEALG